MNKSFSSTSNKLKENSINSIRKLKSSSFFSENKEGLRTNINRRLTKNNLKVLRTGIVKTSAGGKESNIKYKQRRLNKLRLKYQNYLVPKISNIANQTITIINQENCIKSEEDTNLS